MDSTMTDTLRKEEALFIPSENGMAEGTYTPKVEGEYLGHITDTRTTVKEFKRDGKLLKARIFNFKVHVAQENSHNNYTFTDRDGQTHKTTGEPYVGWDIVADGIFRFLEPAEGDTFDSHTEGNVRYLRFCQALGLEIKVEDREVNGKTIRVQVLPHLEDTDINGRPVIAVVGRGKDWVNNEGETVPSWRAKFVKHWKEGKRLATTTTNDLPF